MKKIGLVCLALVLALGALGIGYASWTDTVFISGTVTTGEVELEITTCRVLDELAPPPYVPGIAALCDYTCRDGFAGPSPLFWHLNKNVGWGEQYLDDSDGDEDMDTLVLTLHDVYPCYFNEIGFYVHNNGTLPVKIDRVIINPGDHVIRTVPAPVVRLDLGGPQGVPDGLNDIEILWGDNFGVQIDPCNETSPEFSFWIHVLQDAPQGATLSFSISFIAVQWNDYIAP